MPYIKYYVFNIDVFAFPLPLYLAFSQRQRYLMHFGMKFYCFDY